MPDAPFPLGPHGQVFWQACSEGRLSLPRCSNCGRLRWYLQPTCPRCWTFPYEWVDLSGDAVLYSYTVVHRQFGRFPDDELPYVSAFVNPIEDLGTRLVSRIVDCDPRELEIGMSLQLTFRDVGGRNAPLFTTSKR